MSAAQAIASERFVSAMGPMIYEEQKVNRVINMIRLMRDEDLNLPVITEAELKDCMPLGEAMSNLRKHVHERFQSRDRA